MVEGFTKDHKFRPTGGNRNGVSENDINISQKGSNDTIIVEPKKKTRSRYSDNSTRSFWDGIKEEDRKLIANTSLIKKVQKEFGLSADEIAKRNWLDLSPAVRGYLEAQINGWNTEQWNVTNDEDRKKENIITEMAHIYRQQKDLKSNTGMSKELMKKELKAKGLDPALVDYVVRMAHAKPNGKLDFSLGWFESDPRLRY